MCSKPRFCSKIALKGKTCSRLLKTQKVAPNAKSCSKVAEHNRDRPNLVPSLFFFWSALRTRALAISGQRQYKRSPILTVTDDNHWVDERKVRNSRTSCFGSGQSPCSWCRPKEKWALGTKLVFTLNRLKLILNKILQRSCPNGGYFVSSIKIPEDVKKLSQHRKKRRPGRGRKQKWNKQPCHYCRLTGNHQEGKRRPAYRKRC